MVGSPVVGDDVVELPAQIFDRLRKIPGYTWDGASAPLHSSYDNWHFFGSHFVQPQPKLSHNHHASSPSSTARLSSKNSSDHHPLYSDASSDRSNATSPQAAGSTESSCIEEQVVARVSYHVLREERAFHIAKSLIDSVDARGEHIVRPLEIHRLPSHPTDHAPIIVTIYEFPGPNYLHHVFDMGPAVFFVDTVIDHNGQSSPKYRRSTKPEKQISLQHFLDFAIGATECLEILHHGQGIVHGEIRGDAFHYNIETGSVKLTSFGSSTKSIDITSTGWAILEKELGAMTKLCYISPEQTGRTQSEPDSRTDIYSLGVLFYTLLMGKPVFDGETPLDIVQMALSRRPPSVMDRLDMPEVIDKIIQKCTSKSVSDRYHSASGLRHDLLKVQDFLSAGDELSLSKYQIGSQDVSAFFVLPTVMIGREEERAELLSVIDRVAKTHALPQKAALKRFSDASGVSSELPELAETVGDMDPNRRSGSFANTAFSDPVRRVPNSQTADAQTIGGETLASSQSQPMSNRMTRAWERHQSVCIESRSLAEPGNEIGNRLSAIDTTGGSALSRQLGSVKYRRQGHCEIVLVEGNGGLGKTCLVQSVLAEARRRGGYYATAKFDTARRTAFQPLLKLISSLFKQLYGETNTESAFHRRLRTYVRPIWPNLHKTLGLPEFLIADKESNSPMFRSASTTYRNVQRRNSSPGTTVGPTSAIESYPSPLQMSQSSVQMSGPNQPVAPLQLSQNLTDDRVSVVSISSASREKPLISDEMPQAKQVRLLNTVLDILRMFTHHKFICFFIEDLHFADKESLELITNIVAAKLKMAVIATFRPDEMSPESVLSVLQPPESEGSKLPRGNTPVITRIKLAPLTEQHIVQYVATTLRRPPEAVLPLALVIQSKTAGNPFYIREMLLTCYRKKCVWYEYRDNQWHYDIDKLYEEFKSGENYDVLDTAFITQRLSELPGAARSILAWAALLGNSFSFELISLLLTGEFHYVDGDNECPQPHNEHLHVTYSPNDAVAGLQAAINACVIVPSYSDDIYRFSNDRYIQAASALKECNIRKMHFIIAQTLMKYYNTDSKARDATASHVCEAADIILRRIQQRLPFRRLLIECARESVESGARPTAAKYYSNAIKLLQSDPWRNGDDSSYEETMDLHIRAAECYLYMGESGATNTLLFSVLENARVSLDKAPAWVLRSRIFSQAGNAQAALMSLTECFSELGIECDESSTKEVCDAHFDRIVARIRSMETTDVVNPPSSLNPAIASLGAVLAEAISAAWWSNCLRFYQLSLTMLEMHLNNGAFPQSGMAFLHGAILALDRGDIQLAMELGGYALGFLDRFRDPFSQARGYMIYANWVGHIQYPLWMTAQQLEPSTESALCAGDRITAILGLGLQAQVKFWASENCSDLEAFCQWGCEEIPNWHLDSRGGVFLIAIRQVCHALQGKTRTHFPEEVMCDEQHSTIIYKEWLRANTCNQNRSILVYETMEMIPLYLYGHYDRAIQLGKKIIDSISLLWSARNGRMAMFIYGLALSGMIQRRLCHPLTREEAKSQVPGILTELHDIVEKLKAWQVVSNVNYLAWSKMIEGHIAELEGTHGLALQQYEEAIDHCAENGFHFEEALGNYLMAGTFDRLKLRRAAKASLRDAMSLYRTYGASGVADFILEDNSVLLHGPVRDLHSIDIGIQTDFSGENTSFGTANVLPHKLGVSSREPTQQTEASVQHIAPHDVENGKNWEGGIRDDVVPALDMVDLHAILVSSRQLSSLTEPGDLLPSMVKMILKTCGGSATSTAIVTQKTGRSGWVVSASGDVDSEPTYYFHGVPLESTSLVSENVIMYCTRFVEPVFVSNLVTDERFSSVDQLWLQRNPLGRAVIAIPIVVEGKALGVMYLEGDVGSFTERNAMVLQLLVNQYAISYRNATNMMALKKTSSDKEALFKYQKQLADDAKRAEVAAKEAESQARAAEATAMKNVKLAEDAARAKSIFLANVSHELRTPLNGVIGNSELLKDSPLNSQQADMVDSILVSGSLLLTIINDILDFSRMEADKMKLHITAFNPATMTREVVRAVAYANRERMAKKNVRIIQEIQLPQFFIQGDPIRLHQVIGNLISNSVKFTEDGEIAIGARVDAEDDFMATLTFWVRDSGIGIPRAQLEKLFRPFSQADASTARRYGGSGLGLSICKSLIETMMGGKIKLKSSEGVGTAVWFTVAFEKANPDQRAAPAQSPGAEHGTGMTRDSNKITAPSPGLDLSKIPKEEMRVIIAEDNMINQRIAIQYMQKLGFKTVDAYENGLKAVEGLRKKALEGKPYHIALMDVQMPILDGYEATKVIRKDSREDVRNILVIAMTASAISGDREKCLEAGMNDYLAKPVRPDFLKRKLDAYISGQLAHSAQGARSSRAATQPPPSVQPSKRSSDEIVPELLASECGGSSASDASRVPNLPVSDTPDATAQQKSRPSIRALDESPASVAESKPVFSSTEARTQPDKQLPTPSSTTGQFPSQQSQSTPSQPRNGIPVHQAETDGDPLLDSNHNISLSHPLEDLPQLIPHPARAGVPVRRPSAPPEYYPQVVSPLPASQSPPSHPPANTPFGPPHPRTSQRSNSIAGGRSAPVRSHIPPAHHPGIVPPAPNPSALAAPFSPTGPPTIFRQSSYQSQPIQSQPQPQSKPALSQLPPQQLTTSSQVVITSQSYHHPGPAREGEKNGSRSTTDTLNRNSEVSIDVSTTSSDDRSNEVASIGESQASMSSKRQSKKLVKNRANSENGPVEKPKKVLRKHRPSSESDPRSPTPDTKPEENRSGGIISLHSTSKDSWFSRSS